MKIVLAPDKFKGSLTGLEFCNAVEEGIKKNLPQAEILKLPLADGGDGTIEILDYHLNGKRIKIKVNDPLFRPIEASYLYIESSKTAFVEMAEASGMKLLSVEEQNCFLTSTFGTGEIIKHAINKGAKTIKLGIGGSATNDCGIGMASALGYKFLDKNGIEIISIGKNLSKIYKIETLNVIKSLKEISFKVSCDVTNPLYGNQGAALVYGLQKGASTEEVNLLNEGLEHFSKVLLKHFNVDVQKIKGSGAAGGLGAGSLVFLNAELLSGIDFVKDIIDFDRKIKGADWIITGEGKLDTQTLSGKTIQGVLDSAKKHKIKVAAFCGSIALQEIVLNDIGISYSDAIMYKTSSLKDAMINSYKYISDISFNFAKNIKNNVLHKKQ